MFTYDFGGNILTKKGYAYTTGTVGAIQRSYAYVYGDANWKDKLTAINGDKITSDAIGNPLSDGTWTYKWAKGRQLQSMSKTGTSISYTYNEDGLRVGKNVNGTVTNYVLHGKNVVHLTRGNDSLHFYYGADGHPTVVEYNGVSYSYAYNLQGDVISLQDADGWTQVQYAYDAWGQPISKTGAMANTLGTLNPFRYRGYIYDEETGLYYLRSRYYNPSWGRFINADSILEIGNGYLGSNQFMYCRNTPVCRVDETGTSSIAAPVWRFVQDNGMQVSMADGPLPVGDAAVLGACVVGCLLSVIEGVYNAIAGSPATAVKPSKKIDWEGRNPDHILKGSRNHGGHDWSPFGIGPNDPKAWDKLLPLLKIVADRGQRWVNPKETKPIPNVEYYIYYFEEYAHSIVLKLYDAGGYYKVSDSYPVP